ncbi:hypothetical protein VCHA53O466_40421 [Vibrio chagasii]|nr:hypothetical protein VCHA53O466_40421 [Vibrio chagasii]
MNIQKNKNYPLDLIASSHSLTELKGDNGEPINFLPIRLNKSKNQVIVRTSFEFVSNRFTLTSWTAFGTFQIELKVIQRLSNLTDYIMHIDKVKQIDDCTTIAMEPTVSVMTRTKSLTTTLCAKGVDISLPVTHISERFIVIKGSSIETKSELQNSLELNGNLIFKNGKNKPEFIITEVDEIKKSGENVFIKLDADVINEVRAEFTPISDKTITMEQQILKEKGVINEV